MIMSATTECYMNVYYAILATCKDKRTLDSNNVLISLKSADTIKFIIKIRDVSDQLIIYNFMLKIYYSIMWEIMCAEYQSECCSSFR